jgi:hypothetical protein
MTRRLQFSLGRLLMATTLVTLVASHVYTSWQLKQAREKMASMATELGYLTISDPNRLNVIALKTFDEMTWRWRVHVPEGRQYAVCSATSKIPFVGLPNGRLETTLDPGEYVVTVAVRADGLGKWKLTIAQPQTSIRTTIDQEDARWLLNCPGYTTEQAGASGTEAADDDKPFVLVRLNVSSNRPAPDRVTDGILIWIGSAEPIE